MKRTLALVLIVALALSAFAGCTGNAPAADAGSAPAAPAGEAAAPADEAAPAAEASGEDILICVIAAVTGNSASDGASMVNAVTMACNEINAAGGVLGGRKLAIDVVDGGSTPDSALNVANKVASSGKYAAIFGPHFSSQILAIGDTLAQAEVPVITGGTVKSVLETVTSEWVIRNRCPDVVVAAASAKFMYENMGSKKVGFLCANDDFGTGARLVAQEYFDSVGVEYVSEAFNVDDTDITSQVLKLKDAGVDSLFIWSLGTVFSTVVRQVAELGMNKLPVMASSALTFPDIQSLLDPAWTEGWYVNTHWTTAQTDEPSVAFVKNYTEQFDIAPNMLAAAWYSTTFWMADCIERAGSTENTALLSAIQGTQGFETLSGTFNYADRDLIRQILILKQSNATSYDFEFVSSVVGD